MMQNEFWLADQLNVAHALEPLPRNAARAHDTQRSKQEQGGRWRVLATATLAMIDMETPRACPDR